MRAMLWPCEYAIAKRFAAEGGFAAGVRCCRRRGDHRGDGRTDLSLGRCRRDSLFRSTTSGSREGISRSVADLYSSAGSAAGDATCQKTGHRPRYRRCRSISLRQLQRGTTIKRSSHQRVAVDGGSDSTPAGQASQRSGRVVLRWPVDRTGELGSDHVSNFSVGSRYSYRRGLGARYQWQKPLPGDSGDLPCSPTLGVYPAEPEPPTLGWPSGSLAVSGLSMPTWRFAARRHGR